MTERMKITYSKTAMKHIKSLDSRVKDRVRKGIEKLPEGDIKPMQGYEGLFRLRIGDYRVIYEKVGEDIRIHSVLPRGQVYKRL